MKILWITNILFPDICKEMGLIEPVTGGWMYSLAKLLTKDPSVKLAVASIYQGKELIVKEANGITYFLLPFQEDITKYCKKLEKYWLEVNDKLKPDIIHIHGTEFAHGLAYIKACSKENVVVSIQGLVGVYERYYNAGIMCNEIIRNITFRDIVRRDNIFQQRLKMRNRGVLEQEYLKLVDYVIGRTTWDKTHSLAINPNINYCFCNETLRDCFYNNKWVFENCERHSIFISQATYPIKGLHQVIKALPNVLMKYPNAKLYVGGCDFISIHNLKDRIRQSGYAKYILNIMNDLNIRDKVIFTGSLSENEMCDRYLKSHIFICPSSIENSPNSLGEAQLLGVPCIASYVGGSPEFMDYGKAGLLYRFEEHEMLAEAICRIFKNNYIQEEIDRGRELAVGRHDKKNNIGMLLSIYSKILIKK